jgi:oxygen-dependent protoporphyrinogen oxidase
VSSGKASCIVVGAGFSGLSLAYWAVKVGVRVTLVEENERAGGLLSSRRIDGHLIESAANGFLWSEDFAELEKDLGIRFVGTRPESRKRYIFRARRFRRWPLGVFETLGMLWRFLSRYSRRAPRARETIASWGERLFGAKAARFLLEAVLQGIYAGDPARMSASLIMNRFFGNKARDRSRRSVRREDPRRGTHSHADGMGALAADLRRFLEASGRCETRFGRAFTAEDLSQARAAGTPVLLAVPPERAARILAEAQPELATRLAQIELRSVATATLIYPSPAGERGMPQGFGALFARDEGVTALGVLRNHRIFDRRSPKVSETWIYAGQDLRRLGLWGDAAGLETLIRKERALVGGEDLAPELFQCYFWDKGIPHYTLDLEAFLEREDLRSLYASIGVEVFGNFRGQLGLSRIFGEAKRLVRERMLNDG